jgi:hypothetical protein
MEVVIKRAYEPAAQQRVARPAAVADLTSRHAPPRAHLAEREHPRYRVAPNPLAPESSDA